MNGDGLLDLVTATSGVADVDGTVNVLLGRGDGTFADGGSFPVCKDPEAVALGDFNGDGFVDAVTANSYNDGISIVLNNGDGTFGAPTTISGTASDVAIADIESDGRLDIVVARDSSDFDVMHGAGDGTFTSDRATPAAAAVVSPSPT